MEDQKNQQNQYGFNEDLLKDEATKVALTSKAGGMVVRDLIAKGEQMIQQNSNQVK